MKTLLALFAAVALLVLAVRPALADDDDDYRRGGARWDRDEPHYRGGDYHGRYPGRGFRDRDDYRPRIEHEYHYYHEVRPVYYYPPAHYYSSSHYYYDEDDHHHHHHDNHAGRDLIAIIGGAVLVHEILNH
ncbi:MAG: hypothetical protein HYX64_04415 [Gammaproteobacteria bacterium]|nr:hypothetical protein [Gammaproteobacteria bacterium]